MGCAVLCVMGPGRMQVQWPGRWVAVAARVGVFSWLLLCAFVGLRWGAEVTRLCVCAFDGFQL